MKIESYPYINCRDLHHDWRQDGVAAVATGEGPPKAVYARLLYCATCDTFRLQYFDGLWRAAGNRYYYADDYRLLNDAGEPVSRSEIRSAIFGKKRFGSIEDLFANTVHKPQRKDRHHGS